MSVSNDRKFSGHFVSQLLNSAIGKTLGQIDEMGSHQFLRTESNTKITGIAGDVIEQSLFKYKRDSLQECDIEIDGLLTELKTTGVRIPKSELKLAKSSSPNKYSLYYKAKEGISITRVTLEPTIQTDFQTSHFWQKAERLLLVLYEYKSYDVVPASEYKDFLLVGWFINKFTETEKNQLRGDWEIVRDYLLPFYQENEPETRRLKLQGFTHLLRPKLLLIELVPGYKRKPNGSYQSPRYRLKKTFVDYIVKGYFDKSRISKEISLTESFSSFKELDERCHEISNQYAGKTLIELKNIFNLTENISTKNFGAICIIHMFGANCSRLNQISDFTKAGIIAKTITLTISGNKTEDMKLAKIDFGEWADRNIDFEESLIYNYFCEHSFLCPIFCESEKINPAKTQFLGFKRFAFDDEFIEDEVKKTWKDSRYLIYSNSLKWEFEYDKLGNPIKNKSGSYKGAPNFPKSKDYNVFFRGGANDSREEARSESVNGIKMLPQYFWLSGTYISEKLKSLPYL